MFTYSFFNRILIFILFFIALTNTITTFFKISLLLNIFTNTVIITIFTPTSYGYLPQTIKANDFYDFIDILKGLNMSDLTGSAVEQLSRLEYEAEQNNDYEIKSDLALLNSNFKAPCRIIYRNIAELDKGFIKRFPDQDINLPLSDLGFDYALFKQKMEGLIQGITDKPSLDKPIVAKFLVKLLDINDIKLSDEPTSIVKK